MSFRRKKNKNRDKMIESTKDGEHIMESDSKNSLTSGNIHYANADKVGIEKSLRDQLLVKEIEITVLKDGQRKHVQHLERRIQSQRAEINNLSRKIIKIKLDNVRELLSIKTELRTEKGKVKGLTKLAEDLENRIKALVKESKPGTLKKRIWFKRGNK